MSHRRRKGNLAGSACTPRPQAGPRPGVANVRIMCGVVAVLRRRSTVAPPDPGELSAAVDAALAALGAGPSGLADAAAGFEALDGRLRGPAGVCVLTEHPDLAGRLEAAMAEARAGIAALEADLDSDRLSLSGAELEAANAAIVRLKDAEWAIARDEVTS